MYVAHTTHNSVKIEITSDMDYSDSGRIISKFRNLGFPRFLALVSPAMNYSQIIIKILKCPLPSSSSGNAAIK